MSGVSRFETPGPPCRESAVVPTWLALVRAESVARQYDDGAGSPSDASLLRHRFTAL
jgi:hypothetical protein